MILSSRIICFVCSICISVNLSAQENILDYNHSLKFARYLFTTQQLSFAAQEYERMNYLWPNDSIVILELVRSYRLNGRCDKYLHSKDLLTSDNKLLTHPSFRKEYLRYSLSCRIKDKDYFQVLSLLKPNEIDFYLASYYWVNSEYDQLKEFSIKKANLFESSNPKLYHVTTKFNNQKYKSPVAAAIMSTVLPGSGKAYVNRWGDAFISLLFVSTNAYAAYRAFNKKGIKSINGWIFGGLAFSFYSANIWGSAKAAKTYNRDIINKHQLNAENIIYSNF